MQINIFKFSALKRGLFEKKRVPKYRKVGILNRKPAKTTTKMVSIHQIQHLRHQNNIFDFKSQSK